MNPLTGTGTQAKDTSITNLSTNTGLFSGNTSGKGFGNLGNFQINNPTSSTQGGLTGNAPTNIYTPSANNAASNVSSTTLSNANKIAQVQQNQSTLNNLSQKGVTTDTNGNTVNANGTAARTVSGSVQNPDGSTTTTYSDGTTAQTSPNSRVNGITDTSNFGPNNTQQSNQQDQTTSQQPYQNADTSQEDNAIKGILDHLLAVSDRNTANQIGAIQSQYAIRDQQQQLANTANQKVTNNALLMGGVTGKGSAEQFTPISAQGIQAAQESYGIQQLANLDAEENTQIANAQQAGYNNDFQLQSKLIDNINTSRNAKVDLASKINDSIAQTNQAIAAQALQSNIDSNVASIYANGVTDPSQILAQLKKQGLNISLDQINKTIGTIATRNGIDPSTLDSVSKLFFSLKGQPGGLPASVLALPDTTSQLAAFVKLYNQASASGKTLGNQISTPGAGSGALNVASSAGVADTTAPLSQVIQNVGINAIVNGIIQNEGGSISGVQNNPGNIKFAGLPGQTDSGVQASDGGTFANYSTGDAGKQAIADLVQNAASGKSAAYGTSPTFEQFMNKYTNTQPQYSQQAQDYAQEILSGNATAAQVPAAYKNQVASILNNSDSQSYSPLAASRFTTAANKIVSNFTDLPAYKLTAGGQLYLGRIAAAMKTPGSVSDQDLLDSLTKLNTGGNAISDAQVKLITDGKSFSDTIDTLKNKLGSGGVLSDNQRQQIQQLAQNIFQSYQSAYQPVFDQATSQLKSAGIPKAFWTIPDLNSLTTQANTPDLGGSSTAEHFLNSPIGSSDAYSPDVWNNAQ